MVGLLSVLAAVPPSVSAQPRPDFSGEWVLVSSTATGTRGGDSPAAGPTTETPVRTNTISGAVFNCGRERRIVHTGERLTIERAMLAGKTEAAPVVTLQLNGQRSSIGDSFNPGNELPTTATWERNTLQIASSGYGAHTQTQILSLSTAQLVVVSSSSREGAPKVTLKYARK